MKKLLLAVIKESFENPTVIGCLLMDKPNHEPPYQPIALDLAEKIEFSPPLGDVENSTVISELAKIGHSVEVAFYSAR